MLRSAWLIFLASLVTTDAFPQACGVPEEWLASRFILRDAIGEQSYALGEPLSQSGAVVLQWSLEDRCVDAMESPSGDDWDAIENQCFRVIGNLKNANAAREAMAKLRREKPNSATIAGWAVNDETDEFGHPLVFVELKVAGFQLVTIDESSGLSILCGEDQDSSSEASQTRD